MNLHLCQDARGELELRTTRRTVIPSLEPMIELDLSEDHHLALAAACVHHGQATEPAEAEVNAVLLSLGLGLSDAGAVVDVANVVRPRTVLDQAEEWCMRMAEREGDAEIGAGSPTHPLRTDAAAAEMAERCAGMARAVEARRAP